MFSARFQQTSIRSPYLERDLPRIGWCDRMGAAMARPFLRRAKAWDCRRADIVGAVNRYDQSIRPLPDEGLRALASELRAKLRREGLVFEASAKAFAVVREAAARAIGKRPFDVQLFSGWVLLNGLVAEMATGEGKTLTAVLPAATAALAGVPVHIITVNDYLAARDAAAMGPIYAMLGLSVGVVTHDMEPSARRAAYGCDVTYCTNKEVAFDYLRDRLAVGKQPHRVQLELRRYFGRDVGRDRIVLRGLCFGLVDEADSVLIDEAKVPLIISGSSGEVPEKSLYESALLLARELVPGEDFTMNPRERSVLLTSMGKAKLAARAQLFGGLWKGPRRREALVGQALTALVVFRRDEHYLLREGKVQIIDEYTGRILEGRSWEQGLHQMIEIKEGCSVTPLTNPLIRLTYQRFFRRYLWLAGMTGTAREVSKELWSVYRLASVRIPTNRPIQRVHWGEWVFPTGEDKWKAVTARVAALHLKGRPVLIGTRSVSASEELSSRLIAAGLPHRVLNARQDEEEAAIVACAGEQGRVTVATNMAGRGTDIHIDKAVAELGGLHVIATERHEAGRIDRQLYGRCGRQGDPGSCEAFVSLEDELVQAHQRAWAGRVCRLMFSTNRWIAQRIGVWVVARAQRRAERWHANIRRDLLKHEEQAESSLAFSGTVE
ncbi:preprotein translocase subunit SecA [Nitrospira lenta]|uniref:Protein translocase subunit SecA n=1 Tax=Nitrospira lenta TaxID=1436998 RepID=A0A330LCB7_9BACT|nr:preprotein translocase subunit SecA [Nitrospira lenta]SPP66887.1 Protein translocase subunit SecA 2 [Nitrospira lenta]